MLRACAFYAFVRCNSYNSLGFAEHRYQTISCMSYLDVWVDIGNTLLGLCRIYMRGWCGQWQFGLPPVASQSQYSLLPHNAQLCWTSFCSRYVAGKRTFSGIIKVSLLECTNFRWGIAWGLWVDMKWSWDLRTAESHKESAKDASECCKFPPLFLGRY